MRNGAAVTVIIPALDEEAALPGVLARIPPWVDHAIVVDNGSTDGTAAVAKASGAAVVAEPRRGYGRACQAGIAAASGTADVLVFLDADGSDYPEQMDRLVDPIATGRADLVIGSRTRGTLHAGAMTLPQRLGNALAPALIRWPWGERFTDLGPFRAIRAAAQHQLGMDDQGCGWTVQMQIRAARFGLRCAEVPADYARRKAGRSKISGTARGVIEAGTRILCCVAREYFAPAHRAPRTTEALAVFTRFPEPGRVKTRLIPALGPQGAADLHALMVRRTLDRVAEFRRARDVDAQVWHAGASPRQFAERFGDSFPGCVQPDGDLGARMHNAFGAMLRRSSAGIIIGTDCPELSAGILHSAFEALRTHDLVLGPATDGGYYLIGLRRPVPDLFTGMAWSTGAVRAETVRRASALGLSIHLLPALADVDVPEDLGIWEAARDGGEPAEPELSVVIPTLNEAAGIAETLDSLRRPGIEVIVADGGSTDGTARTAAAHGARVTIATRGRGPQLNAGAALARAERLLFLHADTRLPPDYPDVVARVLGDQRVAVGAFRFKVDRPDWLLRAIEAAVHLRCAIFHTPYGDQALFMRAEVFRALGGYAPVPLMEDVDIVRRAKPLGEVRVVKDAAITSARRWAAAGVPRMTAINQLCLLGFALGIPPHRLATWRARVSASGDPGASAPDAVRALDVNGGDGTAPVETTR